MSFVAAVCVTIVLSLLPTSWLGWVGDVSSIVRLPVAPLGDLGNSAARWLRPPAQRHAELEPQVRDLVIDLEEQRDHFERLYHASAEHAAELEQQLRELQQVPVETLTMPVTLLRAQITTRHPNQPNGPVQLNRGARHGVAVNAIAVYQGVHLVGRVAEVSTVASSLHPISNQATGLIRAAVFPKGATDASVQEAVRVALRPVGDGTFKGDVAREQTVAAGDSVRLFDPAWPSSAQAMVVGYVTSVRTKDDQPLRNEILVQPRYRLSQLADVTLIIEEHDVAGARSLQDVGRGTQP